MSAESTVLNIDGLLVRYGGATALNSLSLSFRSGVVTAVTGTNGAGKSSLLLAIRGTVRSEGEIHLGDADLRALKARDRARLVALVPQGRQLFPRMTVLENLQVMASILGTRRSSVAEAMDRFPILRRRSSSLAGVLSGGEQQMVAVARALMGEPQFLLLDEPMTGLAPLVVRSINNEVASLASEGVGVIVAEPALHTLRGVAAEGHVLVRGTVATSARDFDTLEREFQTIMGIEEEEIKGVLDNAAEDSES